MQHFQTILANRGYYTGAIDGIIGPRSLDAAAKFVNAEISRRKWVQPVTEFVWVRTDATLDNRFSDICLRYNRGVLDMVLPCSTVPGDYWIFNPVTVGGITGSAVACEQQVIGSHTFVTSANWKSLWLGAPYFMQTGAIEIFRDGNRDRTINRDVRTRGWYGINFHRGGLGSFVDNWSAGCQVVADRFWYGAIGIFTNGQKINYTLFEV